MSAPNAGRQSPDPERQSGAQVSDASAGSGKMEDQKTTATTTQGEEGAEGEGGVAGLESNPTHPLEAEAEAKTSKTVQ